MPLSPTLDLRFVAGCCAASATSLVAGLFFIPNVLRVNVLDCVEGETCYPKYTLGTVWQDLPRPLAYLTFAALCWVVLASLAVAGILVFSRSDLARWVRLAYLAGGIALTAVLALDAAYEVLLFRPWWGVLLVLVGLALLAVASVGMRRPGHPDALPK